MKTDIKLSLDKYSPQTNFLLGVCLSGGNVIDFAQKLIVDQEVNKDKDKKDD